MQLDRFAEEVKTWESLPQVAAIVDDYSGSGSTFIKCLIKVILEREYESIYKLP